jgi:hypothetical protein
LYLGVWGLSLSVCDAVCLLLFCWHLRLRGYLSVPLAFAMRWIASPFAGIRDAPGGAGVAPVRGGTYSSLPGKEK